ncbi:MAG: hypothetical protein UT63_C0002G0006 [Candidatus Gottesmanbacteria bacterium GW2011_GWC2_39_8]|uniref:Uncharacterized protein n=1 Tax=Candidatus Gottesmanbacteria bacterium GW2011_GWC2_39_8 TaxID=1618450 RepID=A0A0G0QAJ7_9BACT|nr:MAG: hypothetical protein UT63_C0002G0006 [Candidatus Gottesmanbacteria bacterium GW2011_GWC2_39_8]
MHEKNVDTLFRDLKTKPLTIVIPEYHRNPTENPDRNIKEFVSAIKDSDGFVLIPFFETHKIQFHSI